MNQKKLIIFMPSIEGGGVEKNLMIIANYLANKFNNISLFELEDISHYHTNNKHNNHPFWV